MALFTKKINIFTLCLDKLTVTVYNKISMMCRSHYFCRIVAVILAFGVLFGGYPTVTSAAEIQCLSIGLSVTQEDDGRARVLVKLPSGASLCGIFAELSYDGGSLTFLPNESSADGEDFLFADLGDAVRFVADGKENCLQGGIAELVFALKDAAADSVSFTLSVREAYRFGKDGEIVPIRGSGEALTVQINERKDEVFLSHVSTRNAGDGNTEAELLGEMTQWHFSAGFEITAFDPATGETDRFIAAVTPRQIEHGAWDFIYSITIPSIGAVCITVCPLTYSRSGEERGRSELLTFYNGKLISKTQIN